MLGLLLPSEGKVTINDIELQSIEQKTYKKKFAWASDESYIFNKSLAENISMKFAFNNKVNIQENQPLSEAIKISELDQVIHSKNLDLNMQLSANGSNLSSGQKQRVILAREMYKSADVLILDEATNAIDGETQQKILENIIKTNKNRITFIISHDPRVNLISDYVVDLGNM